MNMHLKLIALTATATCIVAAMYITQNNAECRTCCNTNPTVTTCAPLIACRNYCAEAERAADRRISFYQDPSYSEELDREYEILKRRCREQNPSYVFQEDDALAAQEMIEINI